MLTTGPRPRCVTQCLHVGHVLVQRVAGRVSLIRAALPAVIEIDKLQALGEAAHSRLEAGVIAARTAVNDHGGGTFAHDWAIGHQAGALDIEVDARPVDRGEHAQPSRARA